MIDRRRTAHIVLTMRPGENPEHVPAHIDVLAGAARPVGHLDGGPVDRAVRNEGGAFRAAAVFHARKGLGHVGARGRGYDETEEQFGLSRTYRLEIADPKGVDPVIRRLRELRSIESAGPELLATAPAATAVADRPTVDDISAPHELVGAPRALEMEPGDERVTVAVVDTGVALGHAEFQRKLLSGYDAVELGLGRINPTLTLVGDSHGRDFSPSDDVGHGSHVAGIIGAQGWQVPPGLAGRSLLLPIRVLAGAQAADHFAITGVGAIADIDAGLKVALDLGAQVINMSFGTPASAVDPDAPRPHRSIIDYAAERGCVLVAAAGNSGLDELFYPAAFEPVIAVGSVSLSKTRSSFSTYGRHVDISAPGEDIVSVGRRGYRVSTGTSHAAPFVAGAAALLLSRARRTGRSLEPRVVAAVLRAGAGHSPSPSDQVGAGVLDVPGALTELERVLTAQHRPTQGADHG